MKQHEQKFNYPFVLVRGSFSWQADLSNRTRKVGTTLHFRRERRIMLAVFREQITGAGTLSVMRGQGPHHGPNRWRYSAELMKALTISA